MALANVIRVSVIGSLPNGEVWSVNPVFQIGGDSTTEDVTPDDVSAMVTALIAIAPSAAVMQMMNSATAITGYRVEARKWDGTLAVQAEGTRPAGVAGTGTSSHPYQTSIVSSLRTGHPGASGRGRLYWPGTGVALNAGTLRIVPATVTGALSGVKAYLASIQAAIAPSLTNAPQLAVWSRTGSATYKVSSIQMGDICDVQRRRRDALVETYSALAYP